MPTASAKPGSAPAQPRLLQEDINWGALSREEKAIVRRETQILNERESSELDSGKRIVLVRSILEQYQEFTGWLRRLPYSERTAYRRAKSYEKAREMWPEAVVEAAIARKLQVIGWSIDKPMGLFEDVTAEISLPNRLSAQNVDTYLTALETRVRRTQRAPGRASSPRDTLKQCFRFLESRANLLPDTESARRRFLEELVGLTMTLMGTDEAQKFAPVSIPQDFWLNHQGGYARSPEIRARMAKAAQTRWDRVRGRTSGAADVA